MATPRTRDTRLPRDPKKLICTTTVGDETMAETCPRCGWPCTHLVVPYHDSVWIEHGGVCCECCQEAAMVYEKTEWPPHREGFADGVGGTGGIQEVFDV
jgi:hypothetical protein